MSDIYEAFEFLCSFAAFSKEAVIRKMPSGKYRVLSKKNKNLGTFDSKKKAKERLRQVEFFKHRDINKADDLDFEEIDNFTLSSVMRFLNKSDKDLAIEFLKEYKKIFDKCISLNKKDVADISLRLALKKCFNIDLKVYDIEKSASYKPNFGDPKTVGKYLSDVIKFNMLKISPAKRPMSLNRLKSKIYYLNENEIASKKMPAGAAIGQSITFVKHLLFNHDPHYVREVLNNVVKNL